ncbi:MAG: histidinol dehydrogenase [Longimicrobiales bacterium]
MSALRLAVEGRLESLRADQRGILFDRGRARDPQVVASVAALIADVTARGDVALREQVRRFDGVELDALEVPRVRWDDALGALDPAVRTALEQAAGAIATFHRAQLPAPLEIEPQPGLRLGRRADPLRRVGVYAPGGRATYPSSLLMGAVPARTAGVDDVVVCSPPGTDGMPPATVLAAAAIAGADRVFAVGGAGAIAALARGTETVPAVDRIVGPGNAYVTEAKHQLARDVAIDCPAGPSEILILADDTADPHIIAVELIAQAEHDPDASCVLVTTDATLGAAVRDALAELVAKQPRRAIIESALAAAGALLVAPDLAEAVAFSEQFAPEHLLVLTREPRTLLPRLRAAGAIFLGPASSVAFGDYMTGANHVLPTARSARAYSGLGALDFLRFTTWQELDATAAAALARPTATLADAEGLPAHGAAARLRAAEGAAGASGARTAPGMAQEPDSPGAPGALDGSAVAAQPPALRPEYRTLSLYDPARAPCDIDLSDNTNLWGPNPEAAASVRGASAPALTRYPSVYASELKAAVAKRLGVAPENVTTGCGSDDVIDSALRAFCAPGDTVAYPDPTFGMVSAFARMNAAQPMPVPLGAACRLDVDALLAVRAPATYLCRPNNPTGTLFDRDAVTRLDRAAHGLVLVDEAYIDFAGEAGIARMAAASCRTIALRTLSKACALAGLRVGLAIGPARLIAEIEKSRGPYKVSSVAEQAALAVVQHGSDWTAAHVADVVTNRSRLAERLAGLGLRAFPSAANFLLVALPDGASAADWNVRLRARGVAVRPFAALPGAGECVRVTIGPWPMMTHFLEAAAALMAEPAAQGLAR